MLTPLVGLEEVEALIVSWGAQFSVHVKANLLILGGFGIYSEDSSDTQGESSISVRAGAPIPLSPFPLTAPSLLGERAALGAKRMMEPIPAIT